MYGTEINAKPAEKFVKPIALVRRVGGYWNDVNAGIIALATPVVLFPRTINARMVRAEVIWNAYIIDKRT